MDWNYETAREAYLLLVNEAFNAWEENIRHPSREDVFIAFEKGYNDAKHYGETYRVNTEDIDLIKLYAFATANFSAEHFNSSPIWYGIILYIQDCHRSFTVLRMPKRLETVKVMHNLAYHQRNPQKTACYAYLKGMQEVAEATL